LKNHPAGVYFNLSIVDCHVNSGLFLPGYARNRVRERIGGISGNLGFCLTFHVCDDNIHIIIQPKTVFVFFSVEISFNIEKRLNALCVSAIPIVPQYKGFKFETGIVTARAQVDGSSPLCF